MDHDEELSETTPATDHRAVRSHVIRKTTKLELGIAAGVSIHLAAIVWFFATMSSKVNIVTEQMKEAIIEIRAMRGQAPAAAVLQYRVEKLEEQFQTIRR